VTAGHRVIVVGGGILGVMHALMARRHGFDVVHLERELAPRGASVRNFGLVWVGGRAGGAELRLAIRARVLWEEIAGEVARLHFRPVGSMTLATDEAELSLMRQARQRDDADARQWELLDGPGAREVNPELSGAVTGALWCREDAIVEPRTTLGVLRRHLSQRAGSLPASEPGTGAVSQPASDPGTGAVSQPAPGAAQAGYTWLPGRAAVELSERAVLDDHGQWHRADWVFVCTGTTFPELVARYVDRPKTRRVRLQMLETLPYPGQLTTAVADGDSMRYYPAFELPARASLPPQEALAAAAVAQLLMVQRLDGTLTIGDTHDYAEPFPFDVDEAIYDHLLAKAALLLRQPVPPVARRWAGVFSEMIDKKDHLYWREEILPGIEVVSGPGGRGMTCSPAIAEESLSALVSR
jgi:glycine/D-amino acid oxidase-like deaminating enzyme